MLAESAAGELIASEIEIRSGRAETFAEAVAAPARAPRRGSSPWSTAMGLALARWAPTPGPTTSTSGSSTPPHYNRLREELGYVAQRNNTWSLHVHIGRARGRPRDRRLRPAARAAAGPARRLRQLALPRPPRHRPALGPHARSSPAPSRAAACPRPFGDWDTLRRLRRAAASGPTRSSSRPSSGGACAPITPSARSRCGSATPRRAARSRFALAGLIAACVAQTALDYDEHGYEGGRAAGRPRDRGEPLAGDPPRRRAAA